MNDGVIQPPHIKICLGSDVIRGINHKERVGRIMNASIRPLSTQDHAGAIRKRLVGPTDRAVGAKYAKMPSSVGVVPQTFPILE